MAISEDFQLLYNGLTLGSGTDFEVIAVRGLDDLPEIRTSDTERPSDHGLFPGRDLAAGRTIEIEIEIWGATAAAFRTNVDALTAATVLQSAALPLSFRLPSLGGDRRVNCRPRHRALPVDLGYALSVGAAIIQFAATDPRVYADTETVLTTAAATSGGGRTYGRVYPLTYAAGGTGGNLTAVNAGNFPTRPWARITGPSTAPRLENTTTGQYLALGLTLAAGEFVDVDFDDHTILLGGTASRYSTLMSGSTFWELGAGTNLIKFTAADSMGTLEFRYRSAWL